MQKVFYFLKKHGYWLIGSLLFLAALYLNLRRLGKIGLWFDEAFSVEISRQPLPLLLRLIFGPEPNMAFYYLTLHYWLELAALFGRHGSEFVVRFPSAVFAACASLVVFAIGRRFISIFAGVIAALIYMLNTVQLDYAQQTRSYAMQAFLICAAWYALFSAITSEERSRRWWMIYVTAWTLAVYTHLVSLLVFFSQGIAILGLLFLPSVWRASIRRQFKSLAVSLVSIVILVIPMLILSRQGGKTGGWVGKPDWNSVDFLFHSFAGWNHQYLFAFLAFGGFALIAFYARSFPVAWSLACWSLGTLVVTYIVSQGASPIFSPRYLSITLPSLCLLIALGITSLRFRTAQVYFAVLLVWLAIQPVRGFYHREQIEDWNIASHWIMEQYQPDDAMVCYANVQGCQISIEYYLHSYPETQAHFTKDSPGAYSWERFGPAERTNYEDATNTSVLEKYMQKHKRLFYIVGRLPNDEAAKKAKDAEAWLGERYRLMGQAGKKGTTVKLYASYAP